MLQIFFWKVYQHKKLNYYFSKVASLFLNRHYFFEKLFYNFKFIYSSRIQCRGNLYKTCNYLGPHCNAYVLGGARKRRSVNNGKLII